MRIISFFMVSVMICFSPQMAASEVYQRRDIYGRGAAQNQVQTESADMPAGFDPAEFMGDMPVKPVPPVADPLPFSAPENPPPQPTAQTPPPAPVSTPDENNPAASAQIPGIAQPQAPSAGLPTPTAQKVQSRAVQRMKGVKKEITPSFRVIQSELSGFRDENHFSRFKAEIIFSADVDPASIILGNNFRILVGNLEGNWFDAYPQGGDLQVNGRQVTWTSHEHIQEGPQKLHLRGTIQNTDGDFLDCDGDGKPEGGYLPAYESETMNVAL